MEVEYENSVDDLVNFSLYHFKYQPNSQISSYLVARFGPPILWILGFLILSFIFKASFLSLIVIVVLTAGWIVFIPFWFQRSITRRVEKMFHEDQNKSIIHKRRLSLTEEAITEKTDVRELKTPWNTVGKIVITDKHLFIYTGPVKAHIVPRRAFLGEAAFGEFIETIRRYQESASA